VLRLIIWLILIGLVVYAVFWAIDRRSTRRPPAPPTRRRRVPPAPRGPDDDEEFLRDLDRKWRHRRDDPPG
jgi:hypothetical protein